MEISSPNTLKMEGYIHGKPVTIMVDPEATHNFISLSAVVRLNLPISHTNKTFGVSLRTDAEVQGEDMCKEIPLVL